MSRKILRCKAKTSTKTKPPTIFHIFQFHIRRTEQISHWTITATALPRTKHIRRYEKKITHDDYQLSTKPIQRKRLKIMKMMVSWKRKIFWEESLFEDIVCYILYLIVGVLWYMYVLDFNLGYYVFFAGGGLYIL